MRRICCNIVLKVLCYEIGNFVMSNTSNILYKLVQLFAEEYDVRREVLVLYRVLTCPYSNYG